MFTSYVIPYLWSVKSFMLASIVWTSMLAGPHIRRQGIFGERIYGRKTLGCVVLDGTEFLQWGGWTEG